MGSEMCIRDRSAPGRELRPLADKYRHIEIEVLLNKAEKKLKKH